MGYSVKDLDGGEIKAEKSILKKRPVFPYTKMPVTKKILKSSPRRLRKPPRP